METILLTQDPSSRAHDISVQLREFRDASKFTDIEVYAGCGTLVGSAHRAVLTGLSPVLAASLATSVCECTSNDCKANAMAGLLAPTAIVLDGHGPDEVAALLQLLYSGHCHVSDLDRVHALLLTLGVQADGLVIGVAEDQECQKPTVANDMPIQAEESPTAQILKRKNEAEPNQNVAKRSRRSNTVSPELLGKSSNNFRNLRSSNKSKNNSSNSNESITISNNNNNSSNNKGISINNSNNSNISSNSNNSNISSNSSNINHTIANAAKNDYTASDPKTLLPSPEVAVNQEGLQTPNSNERVARCLHCNSTFTDATAYKTHLTELHFSQVIREVMVPGVTGDSACVLCGVVVAFTDLVRHLALDHDQVQLFMSEVEKDELAKVSAVSTSETGVKKEGELELGMVSAATSETNVEKEAGTEQNSVTVSTGDVPIKTETERNLVTMLCCGRLFVRSELTVHLLRKHYAEDILEKYSGEGLECRLCSGHFKDQFLLVGHIATDHDKLKEFYTQSQADFLT